MHVQREGPPLSSFKLFQPVWGETGQSSYHCIYSTDSEVSSPSLIYLEMFGSMPLYSAHSILGLSSLPFCCKIHKPGCNGKMKCFNNNKIIAHIFIWATSGKPSPWIYLTNSFYSHNLHLLSTSSVLETVLNTSYTLCHLIQMTEQHSRY